MGLTMDLTIGDVGEFRAIEEAIERALQDSGVEGERGNDAAKVYIQDNSSKIVVSCDTAPKPVMWEDLDDSWFDWGWLAITAASSDIASTGSSPLSIVVSLECPAAMKLRDLYRFNLGVAEACKEYGFTHSGGNLREGPRFSCHTTVLGVDLSANEGSNRLGAKPGSILAVVGHPGQFASAYFDAQDNGLSSIDKAQLACMQRPRPKLAVMAELYRNGLIQGASDTSDGLLSAVQNICSSSGVSGLLNVQEWLLTPSVHNTAKRLNVEAWRVALMWGDWNVVVAIEQDNLDDVARICRNQNVGFCSIGEAKEEVTNLCMRWNGKALPLKPLRNEAFSSNAYDSGSDPREYFLKSEIQL